MTRDDLHALVNKLPAEQFNAAAHALWALSVPQDDEPVTDEDREAIRDGRAAYAR